MKEHEELLFRLGEEGTEYFKEYARITKRLDAQEFATLFEEYLVDRPIKIDGWKMVSLFSFKQFLQKKFNSIKN